MKTILFRCASVITILRAIWAPVRPPWSVWLQYGRGYCSAYIYVSLNKQWPGETEMSYELLLSTFYHKEYINSWNICSCKTTTCLILPSLYQWWLGVRPVTQGAKASAVMVSTYSFPGIYRYQHHIYRLILNTFINTHRVNQDAKCW